MGLHDTLATAIQVGKVEGKYDQLDKETLFEFYEENDLISLTFAGGNPRRPGRDEHDFKLQLVFHMKHNYYVCFFHMKHNTCVFLLHETLIVRFSNRFEWVGEPDQSDSPIDLKEWVGEPD